MNKIDKLMTPSEALEHFGITVESKFIPFTESRSKNASIPNLNWAVTVKVKGKEVLTTDYSAGQAHCPGYKKSTPKGYNPERFRKDLCAFECHTGYEGRLVSWGSYKFETLGGWSGSSKSTRIVPDPSNVIWSLLLDSDALNYESFRDWASDYGYDTDSIKGLNIYESCLKTALILNCRLGIDTLEALRVVFQDY